MDSTIIQTPVSKSLRDQATFAALDEGFSSLQDAIRMYLKKLSKRQIMVTLGEKMILLSAKNAKRYDKMIDDVLSGKVKTKSAQNVEELIAQLHAN